MLVFVVLGLVSLVLSQLIGWEERFRNDPFYVLKNRGFPYLLPSVGLGADPGVQVCD